MPDLPISSLPIANIAPPASPMAAVVAGTTSQISITTLLTAFVAQATKASPDQTDELMIYDGTLLKTTINDLLSTFSKNASKTDVATTDEVMIYDGSILKTTVNDILEAFTENTLIPSPTITEELMISDGTGLFKTTVNGLLEAFIQNPNKPVLLPTDQFMMFDTTLQTTTVNSILTTFNANPNKPALLGNEEVMIWDPVAASLLKTTIGSIIGSIISPIHYVYYNIETGSQSGTYRTRNVGSNASFDFTFAFPSDMTTLQEAYAIGFLTGGYTPGTTFSYLSSYGNADTGELNNEVTGGFASAFVSLPDNNFTKFDITPAFDGSGGATRPAQAGDMAGLMITHGGIGATVAYLMIEIVYEGPGGSGSNIIVVDNLTSTSTVDALSANQGRILDITKQNISTLQFDIQALNFADLTVLNAPVNNTDVANKEYVDNSGGGVTVIDNLTSTSATDALSANQGRILNINKQEISTLQTDIEALNFTDLTVLNAPVNNTDVANKLYVDQNSGNINVIDNLNSTSPTDALSANQGRILNENKQDIATLQTDIQALNFANLTILNLPINNTDVANKSYVDMNSGNITVIDNLNSTSATDALSANQGRLLNINKQEISSLQGDIQALNFANLTILNLPINNTDVANKLYVDSSSGGVVVIDNLTSTSTTDALSANQGRILNLNKQEISTLQADIEALSFTSLTVVNAPVDPTDVANKAYVDTNSPITVIDNLNSTSPTDALSANQGRILNINKQDIATLQTDIEAINFNSLTISFAPVNPTDVANKAYVDSSGGGVTVIDNLTSTSATDALSANQGRVLNESKQAIATLQADIEALNFNNLTVVNAPVNNFDVPNKIYVDTVSQITVVDNLTSTSPTDALSANQGRILNEDKQNIATLQTDIQGLSFTELTVLSAPVNTTDVANKNYVDTSFQGTVIDNLTSTSTTDALSANQGRILDIIKLSTVDLVPEVENASFTKITVSNAPVSGTDAANKDYVDNVVGSNIQEAFLPVPNPIFTNTGTPPFTTFPVTRLQNGSNDQENIKIGTRIDTRFSQFTNAFVAYLRPASTGQGTSAVGLITASAGAINSSGLSKVQNTSINWDTTDTANVFKTFDITTLMTNLNVAGGDFLTFYLTYTSGNPMDMCGIFLEYEIIP